MVQTKRLQVTLGRLTVRSQDTRTLGETWLKKPLWDRYHKHWVLGMKYCRCVLILQMQETPAALQIEPLSQCWGFTQFQEQSSTGDSCMAILHCEASTQRTAGRYCRNFAFFIYFGLLWFVLVS